MPRLTLPSILRVPGGRAFASLSRRVRAMIVGGVLFVILFVLALTMPVPYVMEAPGPTCNTLGSSDDPNCVGGPEAQIIAIEGKQANRTTGHLNLTTVSENDDLTAFQAFVGWLEHDKIVVPRSSVYPPGTSQQQQNQRNAADFSQSQENATAAAACELGYPKRFGIASVSYTVDSTGKQVGTSYGKLLPGDTLRTLDGASVTSGTALAAALQKTKPGQKVTVGVVRAGKAKTVAVTLGATLKGHTGGSLGIALGTVCALPFTVDLGLGNAIGGPSAGLMFALGIMAKAGPTDITDGRFIAGTGEITAAGRVGPIGGIALKMIAARNAGATVFLAPADNCNEVRGNIPAGLTVVKVSTLHGAVTDLARLAKHQSVTSC